MKKKQEWNRRRQLESRAYILHITYVNKSLPKKLIIFDMLLVWKSTVSTKFINLGSVRDYTIRYFLIIECNTVLNVLNVMYYWFNEIIKRLLTYFIKQIVVASKWHMVLFGLDILFSKFIPENVPHYLNIALCTFHVCTYKTFMKCTTSKNNRIKTVLFLIRVNLLISSMWNSLNCLSLIACCCRDINTLLFI